MMGDGPVISESQSFTETHLREDLLCGWRASGLSCWPGMWLLAALSGALFL